MSNKKPSPQELAARQAWFDEYVDRLNSSVVAGPRGDEPYPCPCCFCLTLGERGGFEICNVCFWEDDGQDEQDADVVRGGPNGSLSLTNARENYARVGACEEKHIDNVRLPKAHELPRKLSSSQD